MPYTAPIGPSAPGQVSIWDFFDDKVGEIGASPDAQSQAYQDLQDTDFNTGGYVDTGIVPASGTLSAWLKKNSMAVYVGTAALVAMAMFGGRRR